MILPPETLWSTDRMRFGVCTHSSRYRLAIGVFLWHVSRSGPPAPTAGECMAHLKAGSLPKKVTNTKKEKTRMAATMVAKTLIMSSRPSPE